MKSKKKIFHKRDLYVYKVGDLVVWENFSGKFVFAKVRNFGSPLAPEFSEDPNRHPTAVLLQIETSGVETYQWAAKTRVVPFEFWEAKHPNHSLKSDSAS